MKKIRDDRVETEATQLHEENVKEDDNTYGKTTGWGVDELEDKEEGETWNRVADTIIFKFAALFEMSEIWIILVRLRA